MSRRVQGRRTIAFAMLGIVGVGVVYLVAANLSLAWIAHRGARAAGVSFGFASAYTILPGRVHLLQLHLSGASEGGWRADIGQADVRIGLLDLVTRTAHLQCVRAHDTAIEVGIEATETAAAAARPAFARGAASLLVASLVRGQGDDVERGEELRRA